MKTLSSTKLRANHSAVMHRVKDDHDTHFRVTDDAVGVISCHSHDQS